MIVWDVTSVLLLFMGLCSGTGLERKRALGTMATDRYPNRVNEQEAIGDSRDTS